MNDILRLTTKQSYKVRKRKKIIKKIFYSVNLFIYQMVVNKNVVLKNY